MNKWNCDKCGKRTYINPQTEPVFEIKKVKVPTPVTDKDGKFLEDPKKPGMPLVEMKEHPQKVSVTVPQKRQNINTGKVEIVQMPKLKDLQERCFVIRLVVGVEKIQRDVCHEDLQPLMPEIKALWAKLEEMGEK